MLYIKNGRVIDPMSGRDQICDILTEGTKILRIGEHLDREAFFREIPKQDVITIDAEGEIVAPGLVDVHSHFRDPGQTAKEDLLTGSAAAVAGGYTTVVLMANTIPAVDSVETMQYLTEKAKKCPLHVYSCATVTKGMEGKETVDFDALEEAGAVGFTDDGRPILDEELIRKAMRVSAQKQKPISLHEEDPQYIGVSGVNAGEVAEKLGYQGADRKAEIVMVARDLQIAVETGAILDVQHVSALESVDLIREAKKQSDRIHAEATPHHFSLTEEAVLAHGTAAKVNPPIRTEQDRMAIIRGLQDGTLDLIATDHAPHTAEEKSREFPKAPSGMIGLETALALGVTNLVEPGYLSLSELLQKMTINPAKMYGLDAGYLAEGGPADLVIFDPKVAKTFHHFTSKSQNSPFAGKALKTEIDYTISDGKIAYIKHMDYESVDPNEEG
ncbi:MAG: dihydroorotase [Lachnospiraceae bacterium]|nr:dihydroorotase [Lachnospiraceae bacterium]